MKSAFLLSKTDELYNELEAHVKNIYQPIENAPYGITLRSIRLDVEGDQSFILYDRGVKPSLFERREIPEDALAVGYRYGYMVECRSERLFCEVVRSIPSSIDVLVCDSNGQLFKTDQIKPDSITL